MNEHYDNLVGGLDEKLVTRIGRQCLEWFNKDLDSRSKWEETIKKDRIKDECLKKAGFHVLRFEDESVLHHMNWVIEEIDLKIEDIERNSSDAPLKRRRRRPPPTPSRGGHSSVKHL